jgi:small subunit ribosomal protein S1
MEETLALTGQEAMPEVNQTQPSPAEDRPSDNNSSMESLLQEGMTLDLPKPGEIRTGVIARISDNEILISIGAKSEGIINGKEKESIPRDEFAKFEVGKEIPVYVLNPEDQNGNVVLSYVRAREEQDWLQVESLMMSGDAFDSKIIGYNKGGLIVPIGSLRGFVPTSQVSILRRSDAGGETTPDQKWAKMVGGPIKVKVIEVDRERHRLILSERSALQETRETLKERLLDELKPGATRKGRVTSLADFGAFVNIDGADGLVHLSEISWEHIQHPNEVLKVGQEVQVKVISVDKDKKRIGLSIRQLLPDPWLKKVESIKEGQLVEGTITHLTKFGAFARLGDDLEGLIHISELSENRINHPKEVLKEGDVRTLRVLKIDPERRRIGLSLRRVDSQAYADQDLAALAAEASEIEGVKLTTDEPVAETPVEAAAVIEITEAAAPVVEAPVTEVIETAAAVVEAPVTEVIETAAAVVEAPVTEVIETAAVVVEAPVTEVTEAVAPVVEAPVTEVIETAAPVVEAPAAEVTETEAPAAEAATEASPDESSAE